MLRRLFILTCLLVDGSPSTRTKLMSSPFFCFFFRHIFPPSSHSSVSSSSSASSSSSSSSCSSSFLPLLQLPHPVFLLLFLSSYSMFDVCELKPSESDSFGRSVRPYLKKNEAAPRVTASVGQLLFRSIS